MIRIAAVADVHFGADAAGTLRPQLADLADRADVLLVAGDLTRLGEPEEAAVLANELAGVGVPVLAVLGNHDFHHDRAHELCDVLQAQGIRVLCGESTVIDVGGERLGVAGVKGFGVGFRGASCSDFGEPITRAFFGHARDEAHRLEELLRELDGSCDLRVAMMHYSPVEATLEGERPEIWAFLGAYLLGEAIDQAGADLAIHGHAHAGTEKGMTPGGIPVRNVAQPVIQAAYRVYCLGSEEAPRRR